MGLAERAQDCRIVIGQVEELLRRGIIGRALKQLDPMWRDLDQLRDELLSAGRVAAGYNEIRDRPGASGITDLNPDAIDTIAGEDFFIRAQLEQSIRLARDGLAMLCAAANLPFPSLPVVPYRRRRAATSGTTTVLIILATLLVMALLARSR